MKGRIRIRSKRSGSDCSWIRNSTFIQDKNWSWPEKTWNCTVFLCYKLNSRWNLGIFQCCGAARNRIILDEPAPQSDAAPIFIFHFHEQCYRLKNQKDLKQFYVHFTSTVLHFCLLKSKCNQVNLIFCCLSTCFVFCFSTFPSNFAGKFLAHCFNY
jgi:hypothetical protein